MAEIAQFEAKNVDLRPSEIGVEATAAAARRIGASYRQAGANLGGGLAAIGQVADDYATHQDISHGLVAKAGLIADFTQKWNETAKNADPNDPTVAKKFLNEVVQPSLDKFQGSFATSKGQQWAEGQSATMLDHFFQKTSADMSTLAGQAAVTNSVRQINTYATIASNDPSSLKFAMDNWKQAVEAISTTAPNLTPEAAGRVKTELLQRGLEQIVKSGIQAAIEKNPDAGLKLSKDPELAPYIKPDEVRQFENYTRQMARVNASEDRAARVQRDYEAKNEFNRQANELEISTMPEQAGDPPQLPKDYYDKVKALSKLPGASLEPGRIKTMVENGERITARLDKAEPLGPVSHQTTIDLLNRIRATDPSRLTSNDDIYKAYADGKLNNTDFKFLQQEYQQMRTPEGQALAQDRARFFKQYAGTIAGRSYDPVTGSPKLYAAEMDARRREHDLQAKGEDPHQLYDPASPNFLGKPATLSKYQGSMQEDLDAKAAAATRNTNMTAQKAEVVSSEKIEVAPSDPTQRVAGRAYDTPKGILEWTGTGWIKLQAK